jgi:hypothetical protein
MKKIAGHIVLVAGSLLASVAASAAEQLTVAPGIDLSFKSSSFDFQIGGGSNGIRLKPNYTTLTPSLAMNYGRFYGVAAYEFTVNDWNSEGLEVNSPTDSTLTQETFERNETSLTLGYRVFEGSRLFGPVSIFGGYLRGTSGWHSLAFNDNAGVVSIEAISVDFKENGFFLGANYSHSIGNKGTLSVSAAYGALDGLFQDVETSGGGNSIYQDLFSKSTGLSAGVAWNGTIAGNMNYRVGMKYINYSFDVDKFEDKIDGSVITIPSGQIKIKESIYSFYFGVVNYF